MRERFGIVLAGGSGTRLHPVTHAVSKQLVPVYDKPMVYYPLSTLMLAGIRRVLLISTPHDLPAFKRLLGDGSKWGLSIDYAPQPSPDGLAQAFIIARNFLDGRPSCLILGDNLFYGHDFSGSLQRVSARQDGATVYAYHVNDPRGYGVLEFDASGHVVGIEEKPAAPRSNYVIPGLYFADERAGEYAAQLKPSPRGELEVTDLLKRYLSAGNLHVDVLGRGTAWLDTGTPESLLEASVFIQAIEHRQGLKIACLEEVAYRMGYIDSAQLERLSAAFGDNPYGRYLRRVIHEPSGPSRPGS